MIDSAPEVIESGTRDERSWHLSWRTVLWGLVILVAVFEAGFQFGLNGVKVYHVTSTTVQEPALHELQPWFIDPNDVVPAESGLAIRSGAQWTVLPNGETSVEVMFDGQTAYMRYPPICYPGVQMFPHSNADPRPGAVPVEIAYENCTG